MRTLVFRLAALLGTLTLFLTGCSDSTTNPPDDTGGNSGAWDQDLGQAVRARAVWAATPDAAFVMGVNGHLSRYDGDRWVLMSPPVRFGMHGLWGSSPTDVIAVGFQGKIFRFDGTKYREEASGSTAALNCVAGLSAKDVVAAGDDGAMLHYNGSGWRSETSGTDRDLFGVAGVNGHYFAVGQGGVVLHKAPGGSWTAASTPVVSTLNAVWALSESVVFAVGGLGTAVRYDGATWVSISENLTGDLYAVGGVAADDVYAAGAGGLFHWNGTGWTRVETANYRGAWVLPGGDMFVASEGGVRLRIGGSWTTMSTGLDFTGVTAMTGTSDEDYLAFGIHSPALRHEDGAWVVLQGAPTVLKSAWTDLDNGDTYVMGSMGSSGSTGDAVIRLRDDVFTPLYTASGNLASIWGTQGDLFLGGQDGAVIHYDAGVWKENRLDVSGRNSYIQAIEGTAPDDVYAVGIDRVYHFDGRDWTRIGSWGEEWFLDEIAVRGPNDVYVLGTRDVGTSGYVNEVLHYDGSEWSSYFSSGDRESLQQITFAPDGSGIVVGFAFGSDPSGLAYRFTAAGIERELGGPDIGGFDGVWISPSGGIHAFTDGVWTRRPDAPWSSPSTF